jgi:hypothetical protein
MKMISFISPLWFMGSTAAVAVTWFQMRIALRQRGGNLRRWDQWANLGRFRKWVLDEESPARKAKCASLFRVHILATISAFSY